MTDRNAQREKMNEAPAGPKCLNCDKPMRHITRTLPSQSDLPEVYSFECSPCGIAVSHAVSEEPPKARRWAQDMNNNIEAGKTADRALARLIELRARLSPSIADVAAVASEVRVPPGSESFSPGAAANKARVEAWLAIRKVVRTLEGNNPGSSELTEFWRRAIDLTRLWLEAIEVGS